MMIVVFIHVVVLVGGLIAFFHHQNKLRTRAHLMREAALNRDFTFRLPVNGLFYGGFARSFERPWARYR